MIITNSYFKFNNGNQLWVSEGTVGGTTMIKTMTNFSGGTNSAIFTPGTSSMRDK